MSTITEAAPVEMETWTPEQLDRYLQLMALLDDICGRPK